MVAFSSFVESRSAVSKSKLSKSATFKPSNQVRFLIIGYGDEFGGDRAVGIQVVDTIAQWRLPAIKTMTVRHLRPGMVEDIVAADYVVFVEACGDQNCSRTVQLDPLGAGNSIPRTLLSERRDCIFLTLLNLAWHLYGRAPQAWLLQIPTEGYETRSYELEEQLSYTAQRGADRAVQIIEQLLKTYQPPRWSPANELAVLYDAS